MGIDRLSTNGNNQMKKTITKYQDLPFEDGKVYVSKMSTGEKFEIRKIIRRASKTETKIIGFEGIWLGHPGAGICSLGPDRLIPDRIAVGEIEVCSHCGEPLNAESV